MYHTEATVRMLEEENEYEDLPTEKSWVHIAAGCTAGIAEHCTMYPVDLIKVGNTVHRFAHFIAKALYCETHYIAIFRYFDAFVIEFFAYYHVFQSVSDCYR